MRHLHRQVRYALVIIQVLTLASAFFLLTGFIGLALFLIGEISFAEIVEYLMIATTWESISIITFLQGLVWTFFKRRMK
jgi:hypothetical protein